MGLELMEFCVLLSPDKRRIRVGLWLAGRLLFGSSSAWLAGKPPRHVGDFKLQAIQDVLHNQKFLSPCGVYSRNEKQEDGPGI